MRLRKGPTYIATAGSLYTQHLGAVKPQTSPPSCHPVLLVLASHWLELLDLMLPSCSKVLLHASVARMHPQKRACWLALTQAQQRTKRCVSQCMQHGCHHTGRKYLCLTPPAPDRHSMWFSLRESSRRLDCRPPPVHQVRAWRPWGLWLAEGVGADTCLHNSQLHHSLLGAMAVENEM